MECGASLTPCLRDAFSLSITSFHGRAAYSCRFRGHSLPPSLARLVRQCGAEAAGGGSSHNSCGSNRSGSSSRSSSRLVCVDFGSMGRLGLIPDPCYTMRVLRAALEQTGL